MNKQCILNTDDFLKTRSIFKFFNYPLSLQNHPSFSNFKRSMINSKYITFVYLTSIRKISELDEPLYLSHTYILGTEWNKNRLIISHLKIKYEVYPTFLKKSMYLFFSKFSGAYNYNMLLDYTLLYVWGNSIQKLRCQLVNRLPSFTAFNFSSTSPSIWGN